MIQEFVRRFDAARPALTEGFRTDPPSNYLDIVTRVVKVLSDEDELFAPDPDRITEIDHGDYQGTLLYVIAERGYQPSSFWTVVVGYGSCSGCDTLEDIETRGYPPDECLTLALHILQGLKKVGGDIEEEP